MRRWGEGELLGAWAVDVLCEDCGRTRRLAHARLAALDRDGIRTFHQLGSRLRCRGCVGRGGEGSNVTLRPLLHRQRQAG